MRVSNYDKLLLLIGILTALKDGETLEPCQAFALMDGVSSARGLEEKEESSLNFLDESDAQYDIERFEEFVNSLESPTTKEELLKSLGYEDDGENDPHWAIDRKDVK